MMTHDEVSELLGAFALDAVDHEEHELIEAHLAECLRCRAEVDVHREVAAAMGNSVEQLPEGLWSSIASRLPPRQDEEPPPMPLLIVNRESEAAVAAPVFQAPATSRRSRPSRPSRSARSLRTRVGAVAAVAVAAAAAAIVLGVNLVHDDHQISQLRGAVGTTAHAAVEAALHTPGRKIVNVETPSDHQLAEFVVVPDGRGYLVKSSLPVLSSGQTYQLWGVNGRHAISLGLMGRSPNQAIFTAAGSKTPKTLAITVEPAGGSVTPTGSMLGTGTV